LRLVARVFYCEPCNIVIMQRNVLSIVSLTEPRRVNVLSWDIRVGCSFVVIHSFFADFIIDSRSIQAGFLLRESKSLENELVLNVDKSDDC